MGQTSKLGREVQRLRRQLRDGGRILQTALLRPLWPVLARRLVRVLPGKQARTDRIALVLIYQPGGLPASLSETLDALARHDYALFFVVNGALPDSDLAALRDRGFAVMTRPNIGYDFGGYRDGIAYLRVSGALPAQLLVMNDTLWLPAMDGPDTLAAFAQMDAPYAALCNFPYRPGRGRDPALTGQTHAASFLFRVSREVLDSAAFARFWSGYTLSAAKAQVLERGEVGFSKAMSEAGFPPRCLLDHDAIATRIPALPRPDLEDFLRRLPVLNARLRPAHDEMMQRLAAGRVADDDLRGFARTLVAELNPWDSHAYYGLFRGEVNFIKKANLKHPANARRLLDMSTADGLALRPFVRDELETIATRAQPGG
ncbi:rhamnan synthesis F family protein [Fluviibacterium sp. DFM31]|uniref:Rhamnan synthesis F family protein n=1 Tax=Meridianimarinicoccus marinus TaxID=3231483 RepID=A0ABV3L189_9RHOB